MLPTYYVEEDDPNYVPIDSQEEHLITLFQSSLLTTVSMKVFVSKSLTAAILDSGVSSTVAGKIWVDCYIDGLSSKAQESVTYHTQLTVSSLGWVKFFPRCIELNCRL